MVASVRLSVCVRSPAYQCKVFVCVSVISGTYADYCGDAVDRLLICIYCGMPGSSLLSKTGLILARIFHFNSLSVCIHLLKALHTYCACHQCLVIHYRVNRPCLVAARSQGGFSETPPRWHVTIYMKSTGKLPKISL